jgi:hypothetical protein
VTIDDIAAWIYEHLLKLVELFVVVPVGIAAAILALVVTGLWRLAAAVGAPPPPASLRAIVRWPYDAVRHIFTGQGGFQWTPQL